MQDQQLPEIPFAVEQSDATHVDIHVFDLKHGGFTIYNILIPEPADSDFWKCNPYEICEKFVIPALKRHPHTTPQWALDLLESFMKGAAPSV